MDWNIAIDSPILANQKGRGRPGGKPTRVSQPNGQPKYGPIAYWKYGVRITRSGDPLGVPFRFWWLPSPAMVRRPIGAI